MRYGHGNPLRRASEMSHVTGFTQLGIRNVSSSNRDDYDAARAAGSTILSVRDVRRLGAEGVLALVPEAARYYVTIDIDGFDPSIAPHGDHSVHIPCIRAFDDQAPVHIIHVDAHLDFVDERHGVRYGHAGRCTPARATHSSAAADGPTEIVVELL